jgi:hypothetical protein
MYLDSLTTFVFLFLYSASVLTAYHRGGHDMKAKYSSLINRLHRQYFTEMNRESDLLDFLDDMENNIYWR